MILDKWNAKTKSEKSKVKIGGVEDHSSCFKRFYKMLKS